MKPYFKLLRVHQYVKNGFIFLPLFFGLQFDRLNLVLETFVVAIGFGLLASSIYIINDVFDRQEDANHPTKKERPIASGAVSVRNAVILSVLLMLIGLTIIALIQPLSVWVAVTYLILNFFYTIKLKHIALLDITIIAIGFVLRLYVGAFVADIEPSQWLILMTFLLALFMALAKRRDDVLLANMGKEVRKSIDGYNLEFINGAMMIMGSVTIVAYISYTTSPKILEFFTPTGGEPPRLFLSVFFVILGILRYMQLTFVHEKSGSPTKILLKDVFLQLTLLGWVATIAVLLYFGG